MDDAGLDTDPTCRLPESGTEKMSDDFIERHHPRVSHRSAGCLFLRLYGEIVPAQREGLEEKEKKV